MKKLLEILFFFLRTTEEITVHIAVAEGKHLGKHNMHYKQYSESYDKDRAIQNLAIILKADKDFKVERCYQFPQVQRFKKWIWEK